MYFDKYLRGVLYSFAARFTILPFVKRRNNRIIIASHRLAGNAKSFGEWLVASHPELEVTFATDDPDYYRSVRKQPASEIRILSLQRFLDWFYIARSSVILTTHGPTFFVSWSKSKHKPAFFELWHGVGFKGRSPQHAVSLNFYEAVFVSSPHFKQLHRKWGFSDDMLKVTGYSRTDQLVNLKLGSSEKKSILQEFDLTGNEKQIVLVALTWKSSGGKDSIIIDEGIDNSLKTLENFANENNTTVIIRAHLNASLSYKVSKSSNLKFVPFTTYPDTEKLLKVTDILVTDWSSVYTDFLPLKRPIVFVDNQPDFDGSSLTAADRAGPIVSSTVDLVSMLDSYLQDKQLYRKQYKEKIASIIEKAWGDTLDGRSSERYYNKLKEYINAK